MGRFDNIDLGSDKTLRRQIQATVRRRHEDLTDAIYLLRTRGFIEAALVIEAMIDRERKEVDLG